MASALGRDHYLVERFENLAPPIGSIEGLGRRFNDRAIAQGCIDAAIAELQSLPHPGGSDEAERWAVDPGLWSDIHGLVEAEEWAKIPADVVTYVEHHYREWAGSPRNRNGGNLVGKGLFALVLGDESALRLGAEGSEWEGWRALGAGLAQAIGNVDRHRLQGRDDARRYAWGVIGLGSLLLTQMRYEHGDALT